MIQRGIMWALYIARNFIHYGMGFPLLIKVNKGYIPPDVVCQLAVHLMLQDATSSIYELYHKTISEAHAI